MLSPLFDCCYFLKRSRQGEFGLIVVGGWDVDERTLGSQEKAHGGYRSPSIRDSTQWASTPSRCGSLSQRPIAPQQWSNTCFLGKAREQPSCTGLLEIWSGEGAEMNLHAGSQWESESAEMKRASHQTCCWDLRIYSWGLILNMEFGVQCSYWTKFVLYVVLYCVVLFTHLMLGQRLKLDFMLIFTVKKVASKFWIHHCWLRIKCFKNCISLILFIVCAPQMPLCFT